MSNAKSVLDRLKNKSRQEGTNLQQLLQLLCQEEFLRRLSKSSYKDDFVLKGGLFIYILSEFKSRATIDMDFLLRNRSNRIDDVLKAVQEIIDVPTENDYITFQILGTDAITIEKKYPGVSIRMNGKVGNTRTPVNMDCGIGDVITPESEVRIMQTQLKDSEPVEVNTYSLESAVAEKFEAILQRYELTSRMKDFYDLWYIANSYDFNGERISSAIKDTLSNRGTDYVSDSFKRIMSLKDNEYISTRWEAYCRRQEVDIALNDVFEVIEKFIKPAAETMISRDMLTMNWSSEEMVWKERT